MLFPMHNSALNNCRECWKLGTEEGESVTGANWGQDLVSLFAPSYPATYLPPLTSPSSKYWTFINIFQSPDFKVFAFYVWSLNCDLREWLCSKLWQHEMCPNCDLRCDGDQDALQCPSQLNNRHFTGRNTHSLNCCLNCRNWTCLKC